MVTILSLRTTETTIALVLATVQRNIDQDGGTLIIITLILVMIIIVVIIVLLAVVATGGLMAIVYIPISVIPTTSVIAQIQT